MYTYMEMYVSHQHENKNSVLQIITNNLMSSMNTPCKIFTVQGGNSIYISEPMTAKAN